mgnify:FL=1
MSEEITEHVHYDRGYNKGFEEGRKRAFELVGELADFYEVGIGIDEDASDKEKKEHERDCKLQTNACRYAQVVIRNNSFGDEDLPW